MTHRLASRRTALGAFILAFLAAAPLAANQIGVSEPINIHLKRASLRETLQSISTIAGFRLEMADGIEGEVTIDFEKAPWPEVLDRVCREHGLECETLASEAPVLRVRRIDDGAYPLPPGFAAPMSLSLVDADLGAVLERIGKLAGVAIRVADDVEGKVSLSFVKTPWSLVLAEVCRLSGCRVLWGGEAPEVVRAEAADVSSINLSLASADLRETLETFAKVPILGTTDTVVEIDPALAGTVTVDLKFVSWQQAFDLICAEAGCDWHLVYGDPPVLQVVPRSSARARPFAVVEEPEIAAHRLAYRFTPPGAPPVAGTAAFTWAEPIHVLSTRGDYRARLYWIPFAPELSVVLPVIERCDAGQSSVTLLDPIVLPLERPVLHHAEGAQLELTPAGAGAPSPAPPAAKAAGCGAGGRGEIRVTVRRLLQSESDLPRPERRLQVEGYLLVRAVEARLPVAAVIALGGDLDGRRTLALLRPAAGGEGVEIETLSLDPGGRAEKIVRADGHPFELLVEHVEEAAE